ncbi:MAG: TrkH family potassium uptake protein [Gammaproteobacteria bacterium]|nr:TrkH family potassium uptake protein [Gammaproteobacteria bacterium]
MSDELKAVVRDIAVALHIPAAMALASFPVALLADETRAAAVFAITGLAVGALAHAGFRACRVEHVLGTRLAMTTVVIAWGLVPCVGLLPFLALGLHAETLRAFPEVAVFADPWAAAFESFSGFTATGLTLVDDESGLPVALQWWRSFSQWIGGVGVVVLMLTVFHPSHDARRLYFSEGREQSVGRDLLEGVRTIWWIYLAFTAFAILLLRITGMDWWQAVNFGMTGIATGGFSVTDNNLGDFGTAPRLAMMGIVLLGAISFGIHVRLLTGGRFWLLWRDAETRALLLLLAAGSAVLLLENHWSTGRWQVVDSAFQWFSALGTAGFNTVDVATWSPAAQLWMVLGMVVGGAAGSTVGGLKLGRVLRVVGAAARRVKAVAAHPSRLVNRKRLSDDEQETAARALEAATTMMTIWAVILFVGTMMLLHAAPAGTDLSRVLFEVTSALGNVGLSAGVTNPELPWWGKAGLMLIMWMGRLEAVPVLVALVLLLRPVMHRLDAIEERVENGRKGKGGKGRRKSG